MSPYLLDLTVYVLSKKLKFFFFFFCHNFCACHISMTKCSLQVTCMISCCLKSRDADRHLLLPMPFQLNNNQTHYQMTIPFHENILDDAFNDFIIIS